MLKILLLIGLLWTHPLEKEPVIVGSVVCTRPEYRLKEPAELDEQDEEIFKSVEVKSYENIGVYLIPNIYFEGDYSFEERLKYCEAKCLTNSNGEFWFIAKPDKRYRVVAVIGGKMSVAYRDVITKDRVNKLEQMKMRIYR